MTVLGTYNQSNKQLRSHISAFRVLSRIEVFWARQIFLRVWGSDGLWLRISLARALSGDFPLGALMYLTGSPSLTWTRFANIAANVEILYSRRELAVKSVPITRWFGFTNQQLSLHEQDINSVTPKIRRVLCSHWYGIILLSVSDMPFGIIDVVTSHLFPARSIRQYKIMRFQPCKQFS